MWAVTARLLVKSHRNRTCRLCQSGKDVPQGVASPLDCESVHPSALRREREPCVRAGARSPASQPGWEHAAGSAAFSSSCSFQLSALLPVPPRARSRRQKWPHRSASPKRQPVCGCCFRPGCVDWTGCFDSLRACSWRWLTPAFLTGMARTTTSPTQLNVYSALLPSSCGRKTLWMIGAYFSSTRQS
jgi:hypothetical protein